MGRTKLRGFAWAGIRLAVEMPTGLEWELPEALAGCVCHPSEADVYVSVSWQREARPLPDALAYSHDGGAFEAASERGEHWVRVSRDGRLARFDEAFEWARIELPRSTKEGRLFPLQAPLDDLVLIHRTLQQGGLALRATAAVREDRALVILGGHLPEVPSPRTRLWRGWLLVRPDREGAVVYPLPSTWRSEARASDPAGVRIDGLHVLDALGCDGSPAAALDPDLAAGEVLRYAFAPLASPHHTDRVMAAATRLAEDVSMLRLRGAGSRGFEWRSARAPASFGPPAGA